MRERVKALYDNLTAHLLGAEVRFEGIGWVLVDPTPPSAELAPAAPATGPVPQAELAAGSRALADIIRETQTAVVTNTTKRRSPLMPEVPGGVWGTVGVLLGVMLLIVGLSLSGGVSHRRVGTASSSAARTGNLSAYQQFCRVYARQGFPKRPGETPREYLRRLQGAGAAGEAAEPFIAYIYEVCYGKGERDRTRERRLLHDAV